MRPIDADALLEKLKEPIQMDKRKAEELWGGWHECTIAVDRVINCMPTIEPRKEIAIRITRDAREFIGKKIIMMEINGYGIRLMTEDGTRLYYDATDGGMSGWEIIKGGERYE